jgi:hypothetical protein
MIISVFKKHENFFLKYIEKIVGSRTGAGIFDELELEPHKNGPATLKKRVRYLCEILVPIF